VRPTAEAVDCVLRLGLILRQDEITLTSITYQTGCVWRLLVVNKIAIKAASPLPSHAMYAAKTTQKYNTAKLFERVKGTEF